MAIKDKWHVPALDSKAASEQHKSQYISGGICSEMALHVKYTVGGAELTVKTQGPDIMSKDQESEMQSTEDWTFTEENILWIHQ